MAEYGYIRVSTRGQLNYANSVNEQTDAILGRYPNAELTVDSICGTKEKSKFIAVIEKAAEGDTVIVTKLDRFCRTAKEGLQYADTLFEKKVNFHILNMGLIDNTPCGQMILTNLNAYAEFERAMIIERTQGGKAIARQKDNFSEGRPKKYSKKQIEHALQLKESHSYKQTEELTGISKSTLIRAKRQSLKRTLENK